MSDSLKKQKSAPTISSNCHTCGATFDHMIRIRPTRLIGGMPLIRSWNGVTRETPTRAVSSLMVTQDWGLESIADKNGIKEDNGTVKDNVAYTENCFMLDPAKAQATFSSLFHTGWSQSLIESRLYLVLNAVWGLRKFPAFEISSKPDVPDEIHASALNLWLWVATELRPEHIYLCGNWARNSIGEFGPGPDYPLTLSVDEYFDHWRCLKNRQPEIVVKARVILSTTKFQSLPHPSYPQWKWPGYAKRAWR